MVKGKILLVEDDESIGYLVKDNLEMRGYDVILAKDGEQGLAEINRHRFDLCLLDVMLPKLDGFSLAEKIREKNFQIPILFLTARSATEDKLKGFNIGADDYITKPFNFEELLFRIEVFLKRSTFTSKDQPIFIIGKFNFDYNNLTLKNGYALHSLTQKESDILKIFCQHPNTIVKREMILNKVWGDNDYFMGRSLDVFIVKIRKYLSEDPLIEIQNVHGVGFKMLIKDERV